MIRKRKSKDGVRYDPQVWDPRAGRRVGANTLLGEPGTYARRKDAERVERRMKDAVDQATTPTEDRGPTVSEWIDRWLIEFARPKESSNATSRSALKPLKEEHGHLPLLDFPRDTARLVGMERPHTARVAQACWNDAMYEAEIPGLEKNPWMRLKLPPAGRRKLALTEEEIRQLADLAPRVLGERYGVVFRALILFDAYTALRLGELCAQRHDWAQGDALHVKRSLSKVGTETACKHRDEDDTPEIIPLIDEAREALASIPRTLGPYVWTLPGGTRMTQASHHYHWSKVRAAFLMLKRDPHRQQQLEAVKANGQHEFVFHSLRHSTCTLLAEMGVDRWKTRLVMRHKDFSMIDEVYTHIDEGRARRQIIETFRSRTVTGGVTNA